MRQAQRAVVQAMSAIASAMGIREVVQLADSWTRLEGRLKTVTTSAAELASVQRQLVNVANATRTGIEETITLYTRLAQTAGELGMSQSDVVRLTDLTAKTLIVSGTSATQASGALLQFSQALGGGVVRAEEFNSILEGTPVIVQEVARSMGLTVAELRRLVTEGNLTSRQFADAFLEASDRINESFAKIGPTVEGALQQLSNAFAEAVGRGNAAGGATQELAQAISDLAAMVRDNQEAFDAMGRALAGFVQFGTAAADAFLKAGDAVDDLGEYISGAAKMAEGLTNFDPRAYAEGWDRLTRASDAYEDSIRRVGRAMTGAGLNAGSDLSPAGASFLQGLTGQQRQLTASPFGMFGGLGGEASAAPVAAVRKVTAAVEDTKAALARAKTEQEAWEAEVRETERALRAIDGVLERVNDRTGTVLSQWVDAADAIDRERAALQRNAEERAKNAAEAIADQEFELSLIGMTVEAANRLRDAEKERQMLSQGFSLEQAQRFVRNARALEEANAESDRFVDTLRDVLGVAQLIGQAFGDVGRSITQAATGAQSIVGGLQRASQIKNAQGQAVGIGGALSGAAGASGVLAGLGAAGAIAAGVVQLADAVDLFGSRAKQRAKEIAEATARFNEGIAAFQGRALGTDSSVGAAIAQAERDLKALLAEVDKAFRGAERNSKGLRVQGLFDADVQRIASDFFGTIEDAFDSLNGNQIAIDIRRAGAALEEQANSIVALRKAGAISEEEAALALIRVRELYDATVKKLEETAAAAAKAAEAQRAFDRGQFGLDLTQRRQTLNGDSRGAFITGQTIQTNSALAEAQKLVEAGVITQAMFEELRVLLGDEMVQALADFDKAAREVAEALAEQKRQTMEDLTVRALVAQGRTAEAAQAQIEIANRRELVGVTDEVVRAEILRVQGLEATRRELDALAEAERVRAEQNASIDQRMIEALRTLDPARAQQIEQTRKEIERSQELAAAADESTAARLRELYAMQDAAAAAIELADALATQKQRAEALASFTQSIGVQYLRSQGRGFDADVAELREWRAAQEKSARELGAGSEVFAQIAAIFDSRYNALIAATVAQAAEQSAAAVRPEPISFGSASPEQVTIIGEDTTAVRSARSISESSALQLVDYAASQLAVQREILSEIRGRRESSGGLLASPSLDLMDRQLGQRANTAAMLLHGSVR